jgi:hypothetical protein
MTEFLRVLNLVVAFVVSILLPLFRKKVYHVLLPTGTALWVCQDHEKLFNGKIVLESIQSIPAISGLIIRRITKHKITKILATNGHAETLIK